MYLLAWWQLSGGRTGHAHTQHLLEEQRGVKLFTVSFCLYKPVCCLMTKVERINTINDIIYYTLYLLLELFSCFIIYRSNRGEKTGAR